MRFGRKQLILMASSLLMYVDSAVALHRGLASAQEHFSHLQWIMGFVVLGAAVAPAVVDSTKAWAKQQAE